MKNRFKLAAFTTVAILVAGSLSASASPVIDGVISPGEWGAPVATLAPWVNGSDASGGTQSVKLYWSVDATNVYGAVVGDTSLPSEPFANVYVYSSTPSTNLDTNTPGSYGDGDDVLIEGTSHFGFGGPSGYIATPTNMTEVGSSNVYTADGAYVAFDAASLTEEFSIPRSVLGNYDKFRFGGQLFAYEFDTGSGDRVPGALVSVPEPTSLGTLAVGAAGLLLRKRRHACQ